MKILITGTNGFVGKNLQEYFREEYQDLHCPKRADLNLVDSPAVYSFLKDGKFDVVIHCAMTHQSVEGSAAAVPADLVRLSCGIEAAEDPVEDLAHAIGAPVPATV